MHCTLILCYQHMYNNSYVLARCEEFASPAIARRILGRARSLPLLLSTLTSQHQIDEFWRLYERETQGTRHGGLGGQSVRTLQTRIVRALRSYAFAREAWHYLVVPAVFALPTAVAVSAASDKQCVVMPAPVSCGQCYYVDKQEYVIAALPQQLQCQLLTGIMTHRKVSSY
jgi:hypothetical protein